MTSAKKIAANRENAGKSTGPRTKGGKSRSRSNALRHGLGAVNFGHPALSEQVERMAKAICNDETDPFRFEQAIIIAESEILVTRVRAARIAAIERVRKSSGAEELILPGWLTSELGVRADESAPEKGEDWQSVRRALPELLILDRYERRALSRRRRAIRRFDELAE